MVAEIYLNNAGTSYPKPPAVLQAIAETLTAPPGNYPEIYAKALRVIERRLGVQSGRLLLTSSCTQALDVAISQLPWQSGDVLLTSHVEHQAVIRPVRNLVRYRGVKHLRVPYQPGHPLDLPSILRILRQGKTKLLVLSTASNVTGEILPIAEVAEMAHAHGALVFADAAQTFGLLEDTVASLGADLLTFAGHKGPLGPQGIGGLWVDGAVQFSPAENSEAGATCDIGGKAQGAFALPGYCDVGGVNMSGIAGLAAGLLARGEERNANNQRARILAENLARAARSIPGVHVYGHGFGPCTATVSLCHDGLPVQRAEAYLAARGIRVRAGAHCAPDALTAIGAEEGTIRISFGPGNSNDDLDAVLRVLHAVR